jgi:hypothetical protein
MRLYILGAILGDAMALAAPGIDVVVRRSLFRDFGGYERGELTWMVCNGRFQSVFEQEERFIAIVTIRLQISRLQCISTPPHQPSPSSLSGLGRCLLLMRPTKQYLSFQ